MPCGVTASTQDFGSWCLGSNPGRATKKFKSRILTTLFYFSR